MNFSYEEIFSMYGQYDSFVSISFYHDSEAYLKYKPSLMGTFIYSLEERERLQLLIQTENIPRSNQHIRFKPSQLEKLTPEEIVSLDKIGIQNIDFAIVSSSTIFPKENRYITKGEKEIPNTIYVEFDSRGVNIDFMKMHLFDSRLNQGHKLIPEEAAEYYGLHLYYNPDQFDDKLNERIIDKATGKIRDSIRYYQLKARFFNEVITAEEKEEFIKLINKRSGIRGDHLIKELKRSTEKLKELAEKNKDTLLSLAYICSNFDDEVILPYKFPIWWDAERFIHIYTRHVKETKVGERFDDKTIFQYKFRDIKRIVSAVIETVYEEIEKHFEENPDKNFRRMGNRSVYFDGVYYRLEIESSGRLITFHPYNDNEVQEIFKK